MYAEKSLKEYLDDLAAKRPAPGGGSAAALEAATGCALMSMVANFTITNKRYEGVKDKAAGSLKKSEDFRIRLLRLVDEDVRAYEKLSDGFTRYKEGSPEREALCKEACNVPYNACRIAYEALLICKDLAVFGNKNLVTDTAIAALMLESAFFGAKYNVYINLKYINDERFVKEAHKSLSGLEERVPKLKEEILHTCEETILK